MADGVSVRSSVVPSRPQFPQHKERRSEQKAVGRVSSISLEAGGQPVSVKEGFKLQSGNE